MTSRKSFSRPSAGESYRPSASQQRYLLETADRFNSTRPAPALPAKRGRDESGILWCQNDTGEDLLLGSVVGFGDFAISPTGTDSYSAEHVSQALRVPGFKAALPSDDRYGILNGPILDGSARRHLVVAGAAWVLVRATEETKDADFAEIVAGETGYMVATNQPTRAWILKRESVAGDVWALVQLSPPGADNATPEGYPSGTGPCECEDRISHLLAMLVGGHYVANEYRVVMPADDLRPNMGGEHVLTYTGDGSTTYTWDSPHFAVTCDTSDDEYGSPDTAELKRWRLTATPFTEDGVTLLKARIDLIDVAGENECGISFVAMRFGAEWWDALTSQGFRIVHSAVSCYEFGDCRVCVSPVSNLPSAWGDEDCLYCEGIVPLPQGLGVTMDGFADYVGAERTAVLSGANGKLLYATSLSPCMDGGGLAGGYGSPIQMWEWRIGPTQTISISSTMVGADYTIATPTVPATGSGVYRILLSVSWVDDSTGLSDRAAFFYLSGPYSACADWPVAADCEYIGLTTTDATFPTAYAGAELPATLTILYGPKTGSSVTDKDPDGDGRTELHVCGNDEYGGSYGGGGGSCIACGTAVYFAISGEALPLWTGGSDSGCGGSPCNISVADTAEINALATADPDYTIYTVDLCCNVAGGTPSAITGHVAAYRVDNDALVWHNCGSAPAGTGPGSGHGTVISVTDYIYYVTCT